MPGDFIKSLLLRQLKVDHSMKSIQFYANVRLRGIVHLKMTILILLSFTHVVPNLKIDITDFNVVTKNYISYEYCSLDTFVRIL